MRSFTSLDDLNQLPINDPAYPHLQRLIETCLSHEGYDPEADGWIALAACRTFPLLRGVATR